MTPPPAPGICHPKRLGHKSSLRSTRRSCAAKYSWIDATSISVDPEGVFTHGGRNHACPPWPNDKRARWPPYAPFCSDGIGLSVLPGALRLLGLAPVGCRRLTRSRANVTAVRIILGASCVVSAPLPVLSGPPLARGHRSEGGGTFLSGPEGPPSAVRGLLAARAIHRGVFGVADEGSGSVRFTREKYSDRRGLCRREDLCKLPVPRPVCVCS